MRSTNRPITANSRYSDNSPPANRLTMFIAAVCQKCREPGSQSQGGIAPMIDSGTYKWTCAATVFICWVGDSLTMSLARMRSVVLDCRDPRGLAEFYQGVVGG